MDRRRLSRGRDGVKILFMSEVGGAVSTPELRDLGGESDLRLWQILGTGLDEVDFAGFLRRGSVSQTPLGSSARSRSPSMRSSSSSCSRSGSKPPVRPLDDPGSGT